MPGSDSRHWRPKYALCFSEPYYLIKRHSTFFHHDLICGTSFTVERVIIVSYPAPPTSEILPIDCRLPNSALGSTEANLARHPATIGATSTEIPAILEVTHILVLPHFLNKFNDDNAENKVSLESITQEIICSSIPVQRDVAITWDMLKTWTSMGIQQWVGRNSIIQGMQF